MVICFLVKSRHNFLWGSINLCHYTAYEMMNCTFRAYKYHRYQSIKHTKHVNHCNKHIFPACTTYKPHLAIRNKLELPQQKIWNAHLILKMLRKISNRHWYEKKTGKDMIYIYCAKKLHTLEPGLTNRSAQVLHGKVRSVDNEVVA